MVRRSLQMIPAVGAVVLWTAASGAEQADVNIEVSECVALEVEIERYACFERLTAAALADRSQSTENSTSTAAVATPGAAAPSTEEIRSSITALDERRPNEYVITLENGQVWAQSLAKRYPLRVGHAIRIYASRWGDSFRLTAIEANGYIQVERIR